MKLNIIDHKFTINNLSAIFWFALFVRIVLNLEIYALLRPLILLIDFRFGFMHGY